MRIIKRLLLTIFLIPLVILTLILFPISEPKASSTMTAGFMTLNRMRANMTGADGLQMWFGFRTTIPVASGGTLVFEFPITPATTWCRVAGTDLGVAAVANTPGDNPAGGNHDVTTALPTSGALAAACTVGNGTTIPDRITITNVGALANNLTYGVSITNGTTARIGTGPAGQHIVSATITQGATIQTISFGLNIVTNDEVTINANVLEVQTVTCTISANTVNLGNLYRGGTFITGTHTISTSTTASAPGYYWAVYGRGNGSTGNAGLWKSTPTTYLIQSDNASPTVNISAAGSEGFGMTVSQPAGTVIGNGFTAGTPGVFGSIGRTSASAEIILYKTSAATVAEVSTITYGARAGASAQPGAYTEVVTFICGGYY